MLLFWCIAQGKGYNPGCWKTRWATGGRRKNSNQPALIQLVGGPCSQCALGLQPLRERKVSARFGSRARAVRARTWPRFTRFGARCDLPPVRNPPVRPVAESLDGSRFMMKATRCPEGVTGLVFRNASSTESQHCFKSPLSFTVYVCPSASYMKITERPYLFLSFSRRSVQLMFAGTATNFCTPSASLHSMSTCEAATAIPPKRAVASSVVANVCKLGPQSKSIA